MPSEHPVFQRFPSQIIQESAHSPVWSPLRSSAPGADARVGRQSRPLWMSDLSNGIATDSIREQIYARIYRNAGMGVPILNVVTPFCEIGNVVGREADGSAIVEPQYLGNTNQGRTFQLRHRLLVPGYENEEIYYEVRKPHYDYPQREGLGRTIHGTVMYDLLPQVLLFADGVSIPFDKWTCDRDTGEVDVANSVSGSIGSTGGFYILMLMPNKIPMTPIGNGLHKIQEGIHLEEPAGGK